MAELTPKVISELPAVSSLSDADLFALMSNASSKRITWANIKNAITSFLPPPSNSTSLWTSQSGTSVTDGMAVTLSQSISNFKLLVVTVYDGTVSLWKRGIIVIPVLAADTNYWHINCGSTDGYVRCQARDTTFTFLSTSFTDLIAFSISGVK